MDAFVTPLSGYQVAAIDNGVISGYLAGIAGAAIVFLSGLLFGLGYKIISKLYGKQLKTD